MGAAWLPKHMPALQHSTLEISLVFFKYDARSRKCSIASAEYEWVTVPANGFDNSQFHPNPCPGWRGGGGVGGFEGMRGLGGKSPSSRCSIKQFSTITV